MDVTTDVLQPMAVVKYLKENGLGRLVTEFAIKIKEYDEEAVA